MELFYRCSFILFINLLFFGRPKKTKSPGNGTEPKDNKNCDFNYNTSYQEAPLDTIKHPSTFERPSRNIIVAQDLF